ncbi:Major facilitator superfamily, partial [Dillenia turbinata]
MAKTTPLSLRTETLCCLPCNTSDFLVLPLRKRRLNLIRSRNRSKILIVSGIKEKENVSESEKISPIVTGLRVDELEKSGLVLGSSQNQENLKNEGSGIEGFDWNWPPWKNIPQRYKLIATSSLAFVICNMDKVNLSVAIIPMSHQFGWNSSVAGLVQSSFFWGYMLSQLPGGWLAKVFGGRKVLEVGVLTWSFATALVPFLAGYMPGLVFARILVGIGEERSRAVAFVFGGLSVGSVTGLLLAPPLIQTFGWESVFYLFGFFGIAWFLGFQFVKEGQTLFTFESIAGSMLTTPGKLWTASLKEQGGTVKDVPWKAFFQSQAVWAMMYELKTSICIPCSEELNLNLAEAAWVSVLPPLASIFVTNIAAQFADNLIANGIETTTVRKICQTIAFLSPSVCMTLSSLDLGLPPWEIVGILTGGLALSSFALSGLYCTHQDMSPEYASILLGITNTVGAVPGIVGVALTGYLFDSTHSWSMSLFAPSIFFYLTGTV